MDRIALLTCLETKMDDKGTYNAVAEALRQTVEGDDFSSPKAMLRRMTAEDACRKLPGAPYSIATQTLHAAYWNQIWLARLKGEKRPNMLKDWRVPPPNEWPTVRSSFLAGLEEALSIAHMDPLDHKMRSDESARNTLLAISVHTAYHVGQIFLLKRMLRISREG
jgi:uncharacterized damage-inducible protein DinB